jgi:hypothetical protein
VKYVGRLRASKRAEQGKEFDRSGNFMFTIGETNVIEGWHRGLLGMCEGEKRVLHVPASLGYGANEQGAIPANSDLEFDVELLAIAALTAQEEAENDLRFVTALESAKDVEAFVGKAAARTRVIVIASYHAKESVSGKLKTPLAKVAREMHTRWGDRKISFGLVHDEALLHGVASRAGQTLKHPALLLLNPGTRAEKVEEMTTGLDKTG